MSLRSWLGLPFLSFLFALAAALFFSALAFRLSASAFFFFSNSCFLALLAGLSRHSSSVCATSLSWYLQCCLVRLPPLPILAVLRKCASGVDPRGLPYVRYRVCSRVLMHSQSSFQPKAAGLAWCRASKSDPMTWIHERHSACGLVPRAEVITMCATSHRSHSTSLKQLCLRISWSRVTRILMNGARRGAEATAWILEWSSRLRCVPRR
mmetsp:Transcript_31954/g.74270  ORF Transcript_31954/g.74270 Transcript_31954/m.74270 type:complete len:209 (+) Transcript_31954:798-1424(+)